MVNCSFKNTRVPKTKNTKGKVKLPSREEKIKKEIFPIEKREGKKIKGNFSKEKGKMFNQEKKDFFQ